MSDHKLTPELLEAVAHAKLLYSKKIDALTAEVERLKGQVEIGLVAQAGLAHQLVEIQQVCIAHKKDKTNLTAEIKLRSKSEKLWVEQFAKLKAGLRNIVSLHKNAGAVINANYVELAGYMADEAKKLLNVERIK